MNLSTSNFQRSTLNAQRVRIGHWTLGIGHSPSRAFTLIELILVMALLVIVVGVSMPSLKGFFKGRDLDSEARRFLSLTHYAQSRAVSEGVPMELWINPQLKSYGLRAQAGYLESDGKAVEYQLREDLTFEVSAPPAITQTGELNTGTANTEAAGGGMAVEKMRFYPDGFIGDKSPAQVIIRQTEDDAVAIAQSASRLNYEIRTIQPR